MISEVRPVARLIARELSVAEIASVAGGTVSGTLSPEFTCSVDDAGGGKCPKQLPPSGNP